jgi:hypothetical protein
MRAAGWPMRLSQPPSITRKPAHSDVSERTDTTWHLGFIANKIHTWVCLTSHVTVSGGRRLGVRPRMSWPLVPNQAVAGGANRRKPLKFEQRRRIQRPIPVGNQPHVEESSVMPANGMACPAPLQQTVPSARSLRCAVEIGYRYRESRARNCPDRYQKTDASTRLPPTSASWPGCSPNASQTQNGPSTTSSNPIRPASPEGM